MTHPFAVHRAGSAGSGPQVWLLHGVFTDHRLWDAVAAGLGGFDVAALDSPGHGAAPRLDPLPSLDAQAELLADQMRRVAGGRVLLAGHSWGGLLALRLALRHPDLVAGLLLTNTPLLRNRGAARAGFRAQRALLAAGFPPGAYGRQAARALYGEAYRREHPGVAAETAAVLRRLGRRGAIQVLDRVLLEPDDAVDLLAGLEVPTAVLAGEDDYAGSEQVRVRAAAAGHPLRLHGGGHMGPREAPEAVAAALRELAATVTAR